MARARSDRTAPSCADGSCYNDRDVPCRPAAAAARPLVLLRLLAAPGADRDARRLARRPVRRRPARPRPRPGRTARRGDPGPLHTGSAAHLRRRRHRQALRLRSTRRHAAHAGLRAELPPARPPLLDGRAPRRHRLHRLLRRLLHRSRPRRREHHELHQGRRLRLFRHRGRPVRDELRDLRAGEPGDPVHRRHLLADAGDPGARHRQGDGHG